MYWHIDTDIIGLLVLCALYTYMVRMRRGETRTAHNRSFINCLGAGIIMTAIDIAASIIMEVPTTQFLYHLFMTAYLLTQDLVVVLWFLYALTIFYGEEPETQKRIAFWAWGPYALYAVLVLSNPISRLFFTIDANFTYARGPLFLPCLIGLYYLYTAGLAALLILRKKHIPRDYPKTILLIQPVILSVAIPIQLTNGGWLMIFPAYMLCVLLAFLFYENARIKIERAQIKQLTEMVENFASGMAICNIDKGGVLDVEYISSGLARICEIEAETLKERLRENMLTGVYPEDRGLVESKLNDMAAYPQKQDITYRYVTDAGRIKWINISAKAVENENGTSVFATYTDLTELKKAERVIDVALKNTGVSIWEYDFKKRCIIQYQNSTQMHGFDQVIPGVPESLVDSGFVHPDSAKAFLEMYDKLFSGEPFAEGVFRVQTSDRRGYWYEHIRYTNAFDENGQPYRAVGMSTDETQRQEAIAKYEREIEKERGFMAEEGLIAHATFDLTQKTTLDYRYFDGSEVQESDRTTFQHAHESHVLLLDHEERERFLALNDPEQLIRRFASGESEFRQEYLRKMKNGAVSWVRNTLRILRDPRSGNVLLFEYWYDINADKMRDLMYHSIATDNYDFVACIDMRTKSFNALEKAGLTYHMPPQSGEDADAVTFSHYSDCIVEEDRELFVHNSLISTIREHLRETGRFVFTYRMMRPDGTIRHKRITQYYIDKQQEIIAVMREDVTDLIREETDKNHVLSAALTAANQGSLAKSRFLSRVSHELRTPLNAIIGFLELAKTANPEQTRIYLSNSDAAARQLLSIINDVLDVSSIESGKLRIAHAPFDFKQLISNLNNLYRPQYMQKGLDFETVLLTPVDEWLIGDQLRVNQILLNLLNNALKFTEQGHVFLKIRQSDVNSDRAILRFQVEDTGCGMSAEMQNRLFRPFEQENAATAQKYGGSGLGLSIVGSLVSLMDGVVSVKSEQGKGSIFIVDIPFARGETELAGGVLENAEDIRVLAVDSDPADREYVSAVLKRIGVRHICTENVEEAFIELDGGIEKGEPYNVCLIDWKMPDRNGLDMARELRARYGKELYLIVISAVDHYQADESVRAAGANMFLTKPLFQSSLFDLFSTLTNGRTAKPSIQTVDFDLKDMRVLLVEDNAMNRMVAENMIQIKFGIECECAEDGVIARDMFLSSERGHYDAILMDIQMPNMDGYEATEQIRSSTHPDAQDVEIIALTANAFREDVTKSLASGMNAHLSKPIEPDALGVALFHAYQRRRGMI